MEEDIVLSVCTGMYVMTGSCRTCLLCGDVLPPDDFDLTGLGLYLEVSL